MRLSKTTLCVAFCGAMLLAPLGFSDDNDPSAVNPNPGADAALGGNALGLGFGGSGFGSGALLDQASALGIPASAIPGKKWYEGSSLIIALSDDGKKAFGYSERHPRWAAIELADLPPGISAVPVIGTNLAAVQYGPYCYAYSGELGRWDTQKVAEKEVAVPIVSDSGVRVHSEEKGDFVFKNAWGKWFSAEEIKSGAVAGFLTSPVRGGNDDASDATVTVFRLLHTDATLAERVLKQLFSQDNANVSVSVDPLSNSIFVRGNQATTAKISALVKSLDLQTDEPNPQASDVRVGTESHEYRPQWLRQQHGTRVEVPAAASVSEFESGLCKPERTREKPRRRNARF